MKVWIPSIKTGSGSDVYVSRLAASLAQLGVTVELQWFPHYFEFFPLLLRGIKPPSQTDLIFVNSWTAIGFIHHEIPLISCVHHCVHDVDFRPFKSILQTIYHQLLILPFEKYGLKHANVIVTFSKFTQNKIQEIFELNSVLIFHSIDTHKFHPLIMEENCSKKRPFKLLFIGNQSKRKGFDLLATIMAKLGAGYQLYFTSGLRNQSLEQSIPYSKCLGLLSEKELIETYQDSDALLFPTRYEGFGYAAAEAMACGIPVVASDCSSLPELVDDGLGGFLCPIDDIDTFVNKIRLLADNPDLSKQMGEYNRDKVVTYFDPERMGREYIQLFEELLR